MMKVGGPTATCNIEQLQTPSLIRRRRIESDRLGKNLVEDSCRNSAVLVRKNHINHIEKLRQAALFRRK